jgi:hypothetical protein
MARAVVKEENEDCVKRELCFVSDRCRERLGSTANIKGQLATGTFFVGFFNVHAALWQTTLLYVKCHERCTVCVPVRNAKAEVYV